ncbi:hypothetical protein EJB05_54646, partial [Eragrostis curvula]
MRSQGKRGPHPLKKGGNRQMDCTLKDLLPDLERRSPAEVGVGVVGIRAPAPPFTLPWLCSSDAAVGVVLALVAADDEDATGDTRAAVEDA